MIFACPSSFFGNCNPFFGAGGMPSASFGKCNPFFGDSGMPLTFGGMPSALFGKCNPFFGVGGMPLIFGGMHSIVFGKCSPFFGSWWNAFNFFWKMQRFFWSWWNVWSIYLTTVTNFSNGCLGSYIDEERSKMRYVMRIAKPRESSNFWMHTAATGYAWSHT